MDQADHGVAEGCHSLRYSAGADLAVVLAQDHVSAPVQPLLDQPVAPPEHQQGAGAGLLGRQAGDGVGNLRAALADRLADALDPADLGGTGPAEVSGELAADAVRTGLDAPMPLLDSPCAGEVRRGLSLVGKPRAGWCGGPAERLIEGLCIAWHGAGSSPSKPSALDGSRCPHRNTARKPLAPASVG